MLNLVAQAIPDRNNHAKLTWHNFPPNEHRQNRQRQTVVWNGNYVHSPKAQIKIMINLVRSLLIQRRANALIGYRLGNEETKRRNERKKN